MSTCTSESHMGSSHIMQHYRTQQRRYLQWRSLQKEWRDESSYFPPRLRVLRNEWFAKRYNRYKNQEPGGLSGDMETVWSKGTEGTLPQYSESDILRHLDELDDVRQRIAQQYGPNAFAQQRDELDEFNAVKQRIWRWLISTEEEEHRRPSQTLTSEGIIGNVSTPHLKGN